MDSASGRRAPAGHGGRTTGSLQVRHATFLGHPRKRRQPFERHNPLHSSGVAGEAPAESGRARHCRRLWPGLQRGISATAMELSVIAYLILLGVVALLRLYE